MDPSCLLDKTKTKKAMAAPFRYRPLNPANREIRLVHLLPRRRESPSAITPGGASQTPLSCTIQHVSLEQNIKYTALSYVWGNPKATRPILLDGHVFRATENLESALRHFQQDSEEVVLWVDAICFYSNRTATKYLGTMRFIPQFFEGFNFAHSASQISQYILPNMLSLQSCPLTFASSCQFFILIDIL
jgi:hypothetical protein